MTQSKGRVQKMRITEIKTRLLYVPLKGRYHWSIGSPEGFNSVLVELHADNGVIGYGEALGTRSANAAEAAVRSVEHLLLGEDPFRIEYLLARLYHSGAWSNQRRFANQSFAGIEMALLDICGKTLDQPVYTLLGGRIHDSIHPLIRIFSGWRPSDTGGRRAPLRGSRV